MCRIWFTSRQELSTDVYSRRILFFNHTHKMLKYYLSYLLSKIEIVLLDHHFILGGLDDHDKEKTHLTLLSL
jgi:hypothetical protein